MPLLADYAITPDVFDVTSYSTSEVCEARLETIREAMLTEGLVRDLRDGAWSALFASDQRSWHRRGQELIKKMTMRGRLVGYGPALPDPPADDRAWCAEALATADTRSFVGGVITTSAVKDAWSTDRRVERIEKLPSARWWVSRGSSVRLKRTVEDYAEHLDLVLRCSNSTMFIDPFLDPSERRYRDFASPLVRAGGRTPAPRIEVHRACYEGSGPARRFPIREDPAHFKRLFREALAVPLHDNGLHVDVFIWNDFHDRYLISNLIGISLSNGFDVSGDPGERTTWTRLRQNDRDSVQRDFDSASGRHELVDRFTVPS